jgi:hypothetical protein
MMLGESRFAVHGVLVEAAFWIKRLRLDGKDRPGEGSLDWTIATLFFLKNRRDV